MGLPTSVASRMSSWVMPASRATSTARLHSASRRGGHQRGAARIHHRIRHAAHQVLAEAYLRIHDARGGNHVAAGQIAQMGGDGGGTDVDGKAVDALMQSRPDADDLFGAVHGHRDLPVFAAQDRLQHLQDRQITGEILEIPFSLQRVVQPAQVAGRVMHVRLLHLYIMQTHDRIQFDCMFIGFLAHHLAMHLAARGHIDHHVGLHPCRAGQPPTFGQMRALGEAHLRFAERRQARARRRYPVFGKFALGHQHLAPAAQTAAAAHRIDVHAEAAGGLQQRRADGEMSALAGRREDDERIACGHADRRDQAGRRR